MAANVFVDLPAPAGDGVGASIDTSALGTRKVITAAGSFQSALVIEVSQDGTDWAPVHTFTVAGKSISEVAARYMRVRQSGWILGTANVDVSADRVDGNQFGVLNVPAADGTGAALDTSIYPSNFSMIVAGVFTGGVTIEMSIDGTNFVPVVSVSNGGIRHVEMTAYRLRVKRYGTDRFLPGLPTVTVGAAERVGVTGSTGGGVSVLVYGADPTGTANSAAAFQLALDLHDHVYVPAGTYLISGVAVEIPSNRWLEGAGYGADIVVDTDDRAFVTANADLSKPQNITVSGLRIRHTNTLVAPPGVLGDSDGIGLWGENIELRDLWLEDNFSDIDMEEQLLDMSSNIRLKRIRTSHQNPLSFTDQYGLQACTVVGLYIEDCEFTEAWLDGIKLRRQCTTVRIRGGRSIRNGKGFGFGTSGDGIDMFAGAEDVTIVGTDFSNNGGNGVVIKTVGNSVILGYDFNPDWGWMRSINLFGITCRSNKGAGVAIEGILNSVSARVGNKLADAGEDDRPRAASIKLRDVVCENNELQGVICNGLKVSISGGGQRSNWRHGIEVWENARDIDIRDVDILGCGLAAPGTYPAINVQKYAKGVKFTRVRMNGKDHSNGVEIVDDSSYAALTTYHRNGIETENGAEDVVVDDCPNAYVTSDPNGSPVVCFGDNNVILHHQSTQPTANARYYGGRGSTFISTLYGTDGTTVWQKETPANVLTGWVALWGKKHAAQISGRGLTVNRTCTNAGDLYKVLAFDTDDYEYGADADAANNRIQLGGGGTGTYRITVEVRWKSDAGETWEFVVEHDNVAVPRVIGYGRADLAALTYQTNFSFLASLDAIDIIELVVRNPLSAGKVITFTDAMMRIELLARA